MNSTNEKLGKERVPRLSSPFCEITKDLISSLALEPQLVALTHMVTELVSASKGPVALDDHALVPGCFMLPHVATPITRATEGGTAAERAMEAIISARLRRSAPVSSDARSWCLGLVQRRLEAVSQGLVFENQSC